MAAPRTVHVVPHTHWDREWYEPFQRFRMRLVDLVDHVLAEAEADERFCFTFDGQLAAVDDYLEVRPGAAGRVRALVERGQLAIGPWRILSDEFLVSGETLVRNLEQGWARAAELGGAMPVGYLPDEFGHVAQLPQLLRRAGLRDACVWRGVPAAVDRHVFDWVAPDGSSVRCEYLARGYGNAARLFDEVGALPEAVPRLVESMRPFFGDDEVLAMYGTDHTWPITALAQVAGDHADGHLLHVTTLARYVAETAYDGEPRGRWAGELRSYARANLLPGVTSARVPLKQAQGEAERLLERYAEPWSALWLPPEAWPAPFLDIAWGKVVECSGHDSVTGCGHDEVAQQVAVRLAEARQIGSALRDRAAAEVAARAGSVVAVNPSPWPRTEVVELPGGRPEVVAVPALGWAAAEPAESPYRPVVLGSDGGWPTLDNGLVRVGLRPDGTLDVTGAGGTLRGVGRLVDGGDAGDLYNYAPPDTDTVVDAADAVETTEQDCGPLRGRFGYRRRYAWPVAAAPDWTARSAERAPVDVATVVELRAGEPFVRLTVSLVNAVRDHRLRLHVGVGAEAAGGSDAEGQFAVVHRGLDAEGGHGEEPLPTHPARGFVAAGGVAVLLDHVTEYELVDGGRGLALTVLRGVRQISRPAHPLRAEDAGPALPTPGGQCLGAVAFGCAVMPIGGPWWEAGVPVAMERYRHPVFVAGPPAGGEAGVGAAGGAGAAGEAGGAGGGEGLRLDGAVLAALRRRGDWLEARVVRLDPRPGAAELHLPGVTEARAVDLLGRPTGEPVEVTAATVRRPLAAWEIATLQLR